jgi:hypothetical protein
MQAGVLSLHNDDFSLAHDNRSPHVPRLDVREQQPPAPQQPHLSITPLSLHDSNIRMRIRIKQ